MLIVRIIIPFTLFISTTQEICPIGCSCINKRVKCTKIGNMDDIPSDTEVLDMSNNQLDELQEDVFKRLKSLRTLNLSYNRLEELPRQLPNLKLLQSLDISHNDLVCDCDLLRLMKRLDNVLEITGSYCWLGNKRHVISTLSCSQLPDECDKHREKCHQFAYCDIDEAQETAICTCKEGFIGNGITCKDKNECEFGTNCHPKAHCFNTFGSYRCQCYTFYQGNGTYCEGINHCLKKDRCRPDEICENVDGGFNCNCRWGFTKISAHPKSRCRDLDECTETKICSELVSCENTYGSYHCGKCPKDYVGDGRICNVACNVTACGANSRCFDIPSGPLCRCPFGMYNHTNKCIMGDSIIKVGHLKIEKYFTRGLRRLNSPAFLEVAKIIEPSLLNYVHAHFPSIVNTHVVKMIEGEVITETFLDLALLVANTTKIRDDSKPVNENNAISKSINAGSKSSKKGSKSFNGGVNKSEIEIVIQKWIMNANLDGLDSQGSPNANVQADDTRRYSQKKSFILKDTNMCELELHDCSSHFLCIPITTLDYKCICEDGYILRKGKCIKNMIVMKISIIVVVVLVLFLASACVVYARMKMTKDDKSTPAPSNKKKDVSFHNPAYDEQHEVSSL